MSGVALESYSVPWASGPLSFPHPVGSRSGPLQPGEVHVWRAWLRRHPHAFHHLATCLSDDERERAQRFVLARDRDRFIVARGLLRHTLSRYLHKAPASIRFAYEPSGKPRLVGDTAVGFNVSHTEDLALYAVALTPDLGIDVERVRADLDVLQLVRQVCTPEERATLLALAPAARRQAFFACWTRKEALVKAWGDGLARRLDSICVGIGSNPRPVLRYEGRDPEGTDRWELYTLDLEGDYVGALAMPRSGRRLRCWRGSRGRPSSSRTSRGCPPRTVRTSTARRRSRATR